MSEASRHAQSKDPYSPNRRLSPLRELSLLWVPHFSRVLCARSGVFDGAEPNVSK